MTVATTITSEVEHSVATVWLDRPEHGNAFTADMQDELHTALYELDRDPAVRAIVITGRGRYFSTGSQLAADGSTFTYDESELAAERRRLAARVRPWEIGTPILAAMNGAAVGIGLTLALQWDIRVLAADAKYGFVFDRRGLIPEANSLWLLPRLIGLSRSAELLLTGRHFSGTEGAQMGLASMAVPASEVLGTTREIAHEIASHTAPLAVGLTKQLMYEMLQQPDREAAYAEEWELFRWIGAQPDAVEGVRAFLEKRPARWQGDKATPRPRLFPRLGGPS